jgi:SAM-dependent methyltransferase
MFAAMKSASEMTLAQECLGAMRNQMMKGPEDGQLLQQVVGMGGSVDGYLYGGLTASLGIRALLMHLGSRLADFKRVLDFGCGSARVLSWFRDAAGSVELHGCDINSDAIAWSKKNIPYASFVHNGPAPPLPYADNFFDFLYGISVFTHLDEPLQKEWLAEVARITEPGGLVFLSIHGTDTSQQDLSPEEAATFSDRGFFYKRASDLPTVEGLPDFYQVAFHTEQYIENEWSKFFEIIGYVRHGCTYNQEMVVLRKPRLQRPREAMATRFADVRD